MINAAAASDRKIVPVPLKSPGKFKTGTHCNGLELGAALGKLDDTVGVTGGDAVDEKLTLVVVASEVR